MSDAVPDRGSYELSRRDNEMLNKPIRGLGSLPLS